MNKNIVRHYYFARMFSCIMLTFLILIPASVMAQSGGRGVARGRVINAESGNPLPNAQVVLKGTSFGAVADLSGYYHISNIPAGSYELEVLFMGFEKQFRSISITGGGRVTENFEMKTIIILGEAILIEGTLRSGEVEALTRQRVADNIKNVVAEDQIEAFPDPNVAEALQRIPGISITRDQGEGRYVLIRGMEAKLNAMTINGERLPSPEGDVRQVALDVIPADLISSIEVIKALTPDMDADAIGGSVNLITKSARDYDGHVFKCNFSGGYNDIINDGIIKLGLTWGSTFGEDDKFSVLLSSNFYKSCKGSDNNEFSYSEEEINGTDQWVLEDFQLRDYEVTRQRFGISGTFDYKPDDKSRYFFRTIFNDFDDSENRRRFRFRPGKGDYTSAFSAEEARIERDIKDRFEGQRIMSYIFGGEHELPSLDIDYQVSYSYAEEKEPDRLDATFKYKDVNMAWTADSDFPAFTLAGGFNAFDYDNFEFDDIVKEDNLTKDENITAQLNFEKPFSFSSGTGSFKFGGKVRDKSKERTNDVKIYGWDGDSDLLMSQVSGTWEDTEFLDSRYRFGLSPDPGRMHRFFRNNFSSFELEEEDSRVDTDPSNYDASENIYAAYGRFKFNIRKSMLLFGLRLEHTRIKYTGNLVSLNEDGDYDGTTSITDENDYTKVFPMIHYKYSFNESTNMRAAFTTSLARPNYYSLVPYSLINREDEEIEKGNPLLDPTLAYNFDIMFENYLKPVGIVSGGFFYKNLNDYIYPSTYVETNDSRYDRYRITQVQNGKSAELYGIELNWQHELTFLPGALNGLGMYVNYTWTDSKAEFPGRVGKTANLPGQSEHMANFAVAYEKKGFSGRVSMNWHGKYLDQVGPTPEEDVYYDNHVQWDMSLSQKINKNIKVYTEILNLGNEPLRYYQGVDSRPLQQEYYSWWGNFGVKLEM